MVLKIWAICWVGWTWAECYPECRKCWAKPVSACGQHTVLGTKKGYGKTEKVMKRLRFFDFNSKEEFRGNDARNNGKRIQ